MSHSSQHPANNTSDLFVKLQLHNGTFRVCQCFYSYLPQLNQDRADVSLSVCVKHCNSFPLITSGVISPVAVIYSDLFKSWKVTEFAAALMRLFALNEPFFYLLY